MLKNTFFYGFLLLFLVSCGEAATTAEAETETMPPSEEAAPAAIMLTDMPAATSFPDAAITDMKYEGGKFMFTATGYEFGVQTPDADQLMCANSDKGQHIHLIVDNGPYMAKYTPEFEQAIEDGEHHILAFLSRSYHLSIKNPAAGRAMKVTAQDGTFTAAEDITEPMLFYSRPKGTYRGKKATENVILDFYPVNAPADQYQVKAEINGQSFVLDGYQPRYIKGLPMGENTVTLTLLDQAGEVVDTPLNPVTRTFTLEELPTGE
ncbi:MAG: phosphopeptide-binding protein [Bacteroidota bacterium]